MPIAVLVTSWAFMWFGAASLAEEPKEPVYKGKSLSAWLAMLQDLDVETRRLASESLSAIGGKAKAATPALIEALKVTNEDTTVRVHVLHTLGKIGQEGKAAIPVVIPLAKDKDSLVRRAAINTLTEMKTLTKATEVTLLEAMDDEEWEIRIAAILALEKLAQDPSVAVPSLLKTLTDPIGAVRVAAIGRLGRMGPMAKDAVRALMDRSSLGSVRVTFGDLSKYYPDPAYKLSSIEEAADDAIVKVGKPAVPHLMEDLKGPKRGNAISVLERIGPDASEAVPLLIEQLDDPVMRVPAAVALVRISPKHAKVAASAVTPTLAKALEDGDGTAEFVRPNARSAARSLGQIGPEARAALPVLTKVLKSKDSQLNLEVAYALVKISPADAKPAIPLIMAEFSLDARQVGSYIRAIEALGAIGPDAKEAVPQLLSFSRSPALAKAAMDALKRIDPASQKK